MLLRNTLASFALLLLCLALDGCGDMSVDKKQPAQPIKQPYQRFIPIHREPSNLTGVPWSGAFALDTKTGDLCRTYEVTDSSATPSAAWSGLDLCIDVFKEFPD
jgi:hypothetical protein